MDPLRCSSEWSLTIRTEIDQVALASISLRVLPHNHANGLESFSDDRMCRFYSVFENNPVYGDTRSHFRTCPAPQSIASN